MPSEEENKSQGKLSVDLSSRRLSERSATQQELKRRYRNVPAGELPDEERKRIGFAGGNEELAIPSLPRLSSGLEQNLAQKIRENMVPLGNEPTWQPRGGIEDKADYHQVFLALGDFVGDYRMLYVPTSFWVQGPLVYIWRGHSDSPIMGYAIDREKMIRYKWRLDDLGFREFLMSRASDNLMFQADTDDARLRVEHKAKRFRVFPTTVEDGE